MSTMHEALVEALTPPESYFGSITELQTQGWARVFGRHRDSDTLAISNYETVLTHFAENYELNEDYRVEGSTHWLVGWSDEILVRALECDCEDWENADFYCEFSSDRFRCRTCATVGTVRPIFKDAWDFAERLQDYPVLDEQDFSRREHEELVEYIEGELFHATPEEIADDDSWEPNAEDVAKYLFDVHSVSHTDDIGETGWITDAIVANYQKEKV